MSFYSNVENILEKTLVDKIAYLEQYYGISIDIYKTDRDVYTNVYGKNAGTSIEYIDTIKGVIVSDDFFTTGIVSSGSFDEGFLYTSYKDNIVGMTIKINRQDGKIRNYKVESKESIGMTTNVFNRYKINSLAD